jgi:hypothetical protein
MKLTGTKQGKRSSEEGLVWETKHAKVCGVEHALDLKHGTDSKLTDTVEGMEEEKPQADLQLANRKHNDAEVPTYLWNDHARQDSHLNLSDWELDYIRVCKLRYWKRLVATEFGRHCRLWRDGIGTIRRENVVKSTQVGAKSMAFAAETNWPDWPKGSATFFWNWPPEYQALMLDGLPPRFIGDPPRFLQPQLANKDPNVQAQEKSKVLKVRRRGYIGPSPS